MKLRVLLVEDESLVAILLEDMLEDLGCRVVGVASRLDRALMAAETIECDVAVLDINLGGGVSSLPVAEKLRRRGIPFLFATGHGGVELRARGIDAPVLHKPFCAEDLSRTLENAISSAR